MSEFPAWMQVLYVVGLAELGIIWVACASFVILYRPWNPRKHGRAGRHLLLMSYTILGLTTLSLVQTVLDIPLRLLLILQVATLTALTLVTLGRVGLFLRLHRESNADPYEHAETTTSEETP